MANNRVVILKNFIVMFENLLLFFLLCDREICENDKAEDFSNAS